MLTDVLHMYVIHAHGLESLETSLLRPLRPCAAPLPHLSEVWPLLTGVRGGDSYISGGLG